MACFCFFGLKPSCQEEEEEEQQEKEEGYPDRASNHPSFQDLWQQDLPRGRTLRL